MNVVYVYSKDGNDQKGQSVDNSGRGSSVNEDIKLDNSGKSEGKPLNTAKTKPQPKITESTPVPVRTSINEKKNDQIENISTPIPPMNLAFRSLSKDYYRPNGLNPIINIVLVTISMFSLGLGVLLLRPIKFNQQPPHYPKFI